MRRRHRMPFGTRFIDDGQVRFRLWAPTSRRVELLLEEEAVELGAVESGWFEGNVRARAGTTYRFRLDGELVVPDPASRYQPDGVHGPSELVDPRGYLWHDRVWRGRPWFEAVLYELHVGTFSPAGTFSGAVERLDHLRDLGVTAIELMPVADFPGERNWGYDGVLPYAPARCYGRPEDLKALVDAAHARGIMVLLDVVYNHFGPDGNYLYAYAQPFFTDRHQTPWGKAIDYSQRAVRDFVIHNALYWLEEFHLDGLRLDAVHAIHDSSKPDILEELAEAVQESFGDERRVHLILENGDNEARYLARDREGDPRWYAAQWNDDVHHALHVLATGERDGYYADYANEPLVHLGRCLTEGFAYQGDLVSMHGGAARGEPSAHLPSTAFISFLQNHDQIGNRALGERLGALASPEALAALTVILLIAPAPPMLFMGQEWGCAQPFLFFCDHHDALAASVTRGRRREFAHFPEFRDARARARIPDPNALDTFERSRLDWTVATRGNHGRWLELHRRLLRVRRDWVTVRLADDHARGADFEAVAPSVLRVTWVMADGTYLRMVANLGGESVEVELPAGRTLVACPESVAQSEHALPPWSVVVRHDPSVASGLGTKVA